MIFCEAVAIYGVICAIILQTKLENVAPVNGKFSAAALRSGYAIFNSGIIVGLANLSCGYAPAPKPHLRLAAVSFASSASTYTCASEGQTWWHRLLIVPSGVLEHIHGLLVCEVGRRSCGLS